MGDFPDSRLGYERHQRDYLILPTLVVFDGLFGANKEFFHATPNPMFIVINDGIFYHFMSREDGVNRSEGFLSYGNLETLQVSKRTYDKALGEFRAFLKESAFGDVVGHVRKLHEYIVLFTEPIVISNELPLYREKEISKEFFEYCMEMRKEYEWVHKACMDKEGVLLDALEREHSLPPKTLSYLTVEEFERFLLLGAVPEDVEKRREFVIVSYDTNGAHLSYDRHVLEHFGFKDYRGIREFSGTVAQKGHVSGKVRRIHRVEEIANMQASEILVVSMTDPRYVGAMRKAAAIVTDEGGITCHAAIVSRELGVPCIIGTKIATEVLPDGDMVDVDADLGVVTRLGER